MSHEFLWLFLNIKSFAGFVFFWGGVYTYSLSRDDLVLVPVGPLKAEKMLLNRIQTNLTHLFL